MLCVKTSQLYTHTFSLSSPVIIKRSQTLKIQRCKRSGTKSPTIRERRSERRSERSTGPLCGIKEFSHRPGVNRTDARQSSTPCFDPHMANKFAYPHRAALHAVAAGCRVTRVAERSEGLTRVRRSRDDGSIHVIEESFLPHTYLKWHSHSERSDKTSLLNTIN